MILNLNKILYKVNKHNIFVKEQLENYMFLNSYHNHEVANWAGVPIEVIKMILNGQADRVDLNNYIRIMSLMGLLNDNLHTPIENYYLSLKRNWKEKVDADELKEVATDIIETLKNTTKENLEEVYKKCEDKILKLLKKN